MKHTLYIPFLCGLLMSCLSKSPQATRAERQAKLDSSTVRVFLDYGKLAFDAPQSLNQFLRLFEEHTQLELENFKLQQDADSLYGFRQNWGTVTVTKLRDNRYAILEHYILPIGSVYGKVALVQYFFNPYKGTIRRDEAFEPQFKLYDYWSNHVVKEYDSYLSRAEFTTSAIQQVPHQAHQALRYLMFNLTLAAVLEDCTPCRERMERIHQDYPFVAEQPYYDQNLDVCRTILGRFSAPSLQ